MGPVREVAKALAKRKDDPVMPVAYTTAVKALAECCNLDEASTFVDSSEALAAWARIYKKNEAGRQARQLRLHAYRRMGQIARELAPVKPIPGGGRQAGPVAKLREHGLSRHGADAANHLGKMGDEDFDAVVNQDIPPAPTSVARRFREPSQLTAWRALQQRKGTPFACSTFVQKTDPATVAKTLSADERDVARRSTENMIRWLQAFNRALSNC